MAQASITINGTPGSSLALPLNTLVQLDNQNVGGELSFKWEILDQPPGTADVLSSSTIKNPTFTPRKEGTYLLKLTVNEGLVTEQIGKAVAAVAQLKTRERIPAAGETTEANASDGWAVSMNSLLRRIDGLLSDPGIIIGVNTSGSVRGRGDVVRATASQVIKSGLPGQESVPGFSLATAATLGQVDELLCIIEGGIDGSTSIPAGGTPESRLMKVRYIGRFTGAAGSPAVGDTVFLNDSGVLSLTQGTVRRRVGSVMATSGGTYDVWFNGVGGADVDQTPIDRTYLVHGSGGTLPNAVRVDGANASARASSFRFQTSSAAVVPLQAKGANAQTADLFQALNSVDTVMAKVTADGSMVLSNALTVPGTLAVQTTGKLEVKSGGSSWNFKSHSTTAMRVWNDAMEANFPGLFSGIMFNSSSESVLLQFNAINAGGFVGTDPIGDFGGSFNFGIGANNGADLAFLTSDAVRWSIAGMDGTLAAQDAPHRISNVADPAADRDALTRRYWRANTAHELTNGIINGDFRWWQRMNAAGYIDLDNSTTTPGTTVRTTGGGARKAYFADRWYAFSYYSGGFNPFPTTRFSRSTNVPSGSRARYSAKLQWFVGPADAGGLVALAQEIDRGIVRRLRGKKVTVRFKAQGSVDASDGLYAALVTGTGAETGALASYTAPNAIATYAEGSLGTFSWQTFEAVSTVVVPSNATTMVLFIGGDVSFLDSPGGYIELAEVQLVEGELAPAAFFAHAATEQQELEVCQAFFEKSLDPDVAVGTLSLNGVNVLPVASTGSLASVPFKKTKFKTPVLEFQRMQTTASAVWDHPGGTTGMTSTVIGQNGFQPAATNTPNTPTANATISGHWTADADI